MIRVTRATMEKFMEALRMRNMHPEIAIRIIPSPSKSNSLELAFDKEKEGDQVIRTKEGRKVLLVGADLILALTSVVIDYKDQGFSILKRDPSAP
jgi:hypothetical protein